MAQRPKEVEEAILYASKGETPNDPMILEKENLIQSSYLKQLMKMQNKYSNGRTHNRNISTVKGSNKSFLIVEKVNGQTNRNKDPLYGNLSRHKSTHSFSKPCSAALNDSTNLNQSLNNCSNFTQMNAKHGKVVKKKKRIADKT
jgi:hypothetical protein